MGHSKCLLLGGKNTSIFPRRESEELLLYRGDFQGKLDHFTLCVHACVCVCGTELAVERKDAEKSKGDPLKCLLFICLLCLCIELKVLI